MRTRFVYVTISVLAVSFAAGAQDAPAPPATPPPMQSTGQGPVKITLDDAIQMALAHNHTLLAARTTITQNEAQEVTANLRPNPVLLGDAQFLPIFNWNQFNANYVDEDAQFDLGVSYLFERGKKRQHRLAAAKDATAVTRSTVADNERTLTFQVAQLFTNAQLAESTLDLAQQDLKSFQNSVDISKERYRAGDISEDDYLKIKLQLLQFQSDAAQATLARVQALDDLRQQIGRESVPIDYDVAGPFDYVPLNAKEDDLEMKALSTRPDLRAAQQSVTAATSQYELAKANGKKDITGQINYTHIADLSTASLFGQIQIPIFDRNQGEIARTKSTITQAQEQEKAAANQVLTDVADAYDGVQTNNQIIQLYRSGYLDDAQQDRDISEYAYKRGAASLLDFLDAERSYRATELAYRQALAAYLLALEQLREAVGTRNLP
ncbi:MAG TPA: TolC family protein [Candidatus Acidoferrales bacterium]|nr:TolC family protein [Candidatus Acidoferrales bacterium]